MRLPADAARRLFALGLTAFTLAGCGLVGGGEDRPATFAGNVGMNAGTGPGADYPMVLGEPFTVNGQLYTPADVLNYDVVGYASLDQSAGVSLAHRTLPLPSYVEVTSLDSGKTILARVERRGPMDGASFVTLSAMAAAQLRVAESAPVRIRRVNPTEKDRAELRAGRTASERMEMPKALVEVLRRKLPAAGWADLRAPVPAKPAAPHSNAPVAMAAAKPESAATAPANTMAAPTVATAYPLKPIAVSNPVAPAKPAVVARPEPVRVSFNLGQTRKAVATVPVATPRAASRPEAGSAASAPADGFVVQAGAFANRSNAQRAADALGGYVSASGKLFRVRTGPFTSRGQAEAALAKVRAAGYSDARVYTAG